MNSNMICNKRIPDNIYCQKCSRIDLHNCHHPDNCVSHDSAGYCVFIKADICCVPIESLEPAVEKTNATFESIEPKTELVKAPWHYMQSEDLLKQRQNDSGPQLRQELQLKQREIEKGDRIMTVQFCGNCKFHINAIGICARTKNHVQVDSVPDKVECPLPTINELGEEILVLALESRFAQSKMFAEEERESAVEDIIRMLTSGDQG